MITVRKHIVTETAHRLLDYAGKCAHVHGHSYKWEVEVGGGVEIMKNGILVDFKDLKNLLIELVHTPYDHSLVLCLRDPLLACTAALAPTWDVGDYTTKQNPRVVVHPFNPTAENLAMHVGKQMEANLASILPLVRLVSFTVWETENSFARYIPEFKL